MFHLGETLRKRFECGMKLENIALTYCQVVTVLKTEKQTIMRILNKAEVKWIFSCFCKGRGVRPLTWLMTTFPLRRIIHKKNSFKG